jgi:hypothetical protein
MVGIADPGCLDGARRCALPSRYSVASPWRRVVVLQHAARYGLPFVAGRRWYPEAREGLYQLLCSLSLHVPLFLITNR